MKAITELYRQFVYLYVSSTTVGDTYLKELGKSRCQMKHMLLNAEADSVMDIFSVIL